MSGPVKYSGADWLANALSLELSPIGREAAEIVGQVYRGLYHLSRRDLRASVWTDPVFAEVRLGNASLATFDAARLTELVVLCHDRCIRSHIDARARGYLSLMFHQREREGGYSERHPTMEAAVAAIRDRIGLPLYPEPVWTGR